ncbi:MAG: sensor histidine kinase [Bacteroidales bacterium]
MLTTENKYIVKQQAPLTEKIFLSYVSHRIRTPLNSVIGFSKLLLNKDSSKEKVEEFAEKIMNSGYEILHYFQNIMDLSELEAGLVTVDSRRFDAKEIILLLIDEFHDRFNNECDIDISCGNLNNYNEIPVGADEYIFRRILANIIELSRMMISEGMITINCFRHNESNLNFRVAVTSYSKFYSADQSFLLKNATNDDSVEYLTYKVTHELTELLKGSFYIEKKSDNEIYFNLLIHNRYSD